mgnify:CR=1 FL=1|jgi:hypothetical protein
MALPTFEYDRRIDIVDALNELSTAADAAIEAGGGSSSYVLPVAADAVLGGVKGQRVEEKDGNGRIVQVTPDGTAFIDAADALNPGVVRSKEGNSFADTDANIAVNAHGYMKCDAPKAYVDAQVAGVEAHLEAFEAEAVTQAEGANAIQATIAPTESAGSKLTVSLKYGTGLAVQNGTLVATGGGEVTQKVVSLAANETLPLGNLTMQVERNGIYFVTVSQQQRFDALLINAVFAVSSELAGPGFNFTCPNSNKATKWVVNSIEAPDLIRTQFKVPVLGGYVQRDVESYTNTYAVCNASETSLFISSFSSSKKSFYMYPLTVVRYH